MTIRNPKGMTIVEMMVAISIFTIGILGFNALFMHSWRSNGFIMETAQASRQAERGINQIIRDVREVRQADDGSFAIKSAGGFDLVVFSNIDGDSAVERVHYFLDLENDLLKKSITKPVGSPLAYPVAEDSALVLAEYIVNEESHPLFSYYDKEGQLLSDPINLADISSVRSVVWVNIKPEIAPENIRLESLIHIRNLSEI
ncbi:MAG TPA: hypothetical protein DIT25_00725 [Candidatus Moranbacteria bacterium]|nr:hypothetical protein [Candidatus Moranbacteria bacterium]